MDPSARWLPGLGLLLLPFAVTAQAPDEEPPAPVEYSSPYAAWDAGAYDQALRGFADHQTERPDDPELSLNVGAAHYKLSDFEAADGEFYRAAAIGDDELRAQALYNLGNSAYRQDKLEDAVDFYMASLEANPDDLDAKFNLEFVRDEMRRRQQDSQNRQQNEQQQEEQEDQGAQQQSEGDQGQDQDQDQDQEDSGQEQDPGDQGREQQPQGGEGPQDSDGDGIPDAEDPDTRADGPESGNQGRPQEPAPGMTPEEAERYLQALEEGRPDPTRRGQRGRRSRLAKDW